MAQLVLKFKDVEIKTYKFDKPSITLGRKEDNDIVIDNMAVSGYHAKIDHIGKNYFLTDLQSLNGTFVNDRKIVSYKLMHDDVITIGKHTVHFLLDEEERESVEKGELDQTMYLDTRKARQRSKPTVKPQGAPEKKATEVGVITFLSGGEGEFELKKKLTKLGKDASCDIVLSGIFVGGIAATISQRPTGYFITYTGGMAKLKINGQTVKETYQLKEFDTIEIGSSKMQFYLK
nr:FHA domain-containing protein [Desulfobacterales bacterium]